MKLLILCSLLLFQMLSHAATPNGLGIGGGGAMSGISFDPYKENHLYLGTDMGLVYESLDQGQTWRAISQEKISFNVNLGTPSHMGFSPTGGLYWASGGCEPQTSNNQGKDWSVMDQLNKLLPDNCLQADTKIIYWFFSTDNKNLIGVGTSKGIFISQDNGASWATFFSNQTSLATQLIDSNKLIHISNNGIFILDLTNSNVKTLLDTSLDKGAIGQDQQGITAVATHPVDANTKTMMIVDVLNEKIKKQDLPVGDFVRMSDSNSSVIYFTGLASQGQGAAIWVSKDRGTTWQQCYESDEQAYSQGKINGNPIGLYVGFWDSVYNDFQVSSADPNNVAASGNFFFKISNDGGETWAFPYAQESEETKTITKADFWKSTQLNPISIFAMKRNPSNPAMIVVGLADIGCMLTKDNGQNWRLCNIPNMNSVYDIEFNPEQPNQIYVAASSIHDYPLDWHGDILNHVPGGLFLSNDEGVNWQRISPESDEFQNPYLSIAIDFQQTPCNIYAGTQGKGIIASLDCGSTWLRLNDGFEPASSSEDSSNQQGALIFPRIKISPKTHDVYALHSGNRLWQDASNTYLHYTGVYKLDRQTQHWQQLGHPKTVQAPGNGGLYWKYPIDFTIDWTNPNHIYLLDMATAGTWKIAGVWQSTDEGQSWGQVLQFDNCRRLYMRGETAYVAGWSDPGTPFIYKSTDGTTFTPLDIRLPLQRVNDFLFDNNPWLWGTFGGGLFTIAGE